ncbi:hypothetical protein ACFQ12_12145, partial [Methylobacterium trifolii]
RPGGPAAGSEGTSTERTETEDGTRVVSIRIHAGPRPFDEQHTVVAPDGESRVFETSGATQTIRDGQSGEVLARSTFTAEGVEPEAVVQPAFLATVPAVVARTIELAGALFAVLSARRDGFGTVLGMSAQEYRPAEGFDENPALWVGQLDQAGLDAACPRNGEVQALTDSVAASVRASGLYRSALDFGNQVHSVIANIVNDRNDPDLKAEVSMAPTGPTGRIGQIGTVRLDLYERSMPGTTCIYDYKTGQRGLGPLRALNLATIAKRYFPDTQRIIVIQVRPSR